MINAPQLTHAKPQLTTTRRMFKSSKRLLKLKRSPGEAPLLKGKPQLTTAKLRL